MAKTTAPVFTTTAGWAELYRPRRFEEIVGQASAINELKGILKTMELPNGFIFYGPPGTGKTTLGTVFARYINCATLNACGKCESCIAMNHDRHPDVHHINATADSGVDNVRSLIQKAQYAPQHNVRVFIIDEAQGMSKPAMDALLVPVEKPPGATLYIFCTTDPMRLPSTLLGRVSNIEVKRTPAPALVARLKQIAARKKITFPEAVYQQCAQAESTRVAVALLQKAYYQISNNPNVELPALLTAIGGFADEETSQVAQRLLLGLYANANKLIVSACYEAKDAVGVINQCQFNNQFVLGSLVGAKSGMIWAPVNRDFLKLAKEKLGDRLTLGNVLNATRKLAEARNKLVSNSAGSLPILISTLSCVTKEPT